MKAKKRCIFCDFDQPSEAQAQSSREYISFYLLLLRHINIVHSLYTAHISICVYKDHR